MSRVDLKSSGIEQADMYKKSRRPQLVQSSSSFAKFKLHQQPFLNRSNSTDLSPKQSGMGKLNSSCSNIRMPLKSIAKLCDADRREPNIEAGQRTAEAAHSIIQMHKFFKEKNIYSDPNDNYKRRTIVLVKGGRGSQSPAHHEANNSEFGFHLQSYGLVNTSTQQTEFICFVNNVQANSPAQQAGLSNGDVLLALDNIPINEFRNLNEIMKHVRNKQELRLVVMCENICKKIQLQQRLEHLKLLLSEKKSELERIQKQQDAILSSSKAHLLPTFTSPTSSSSNSLTNSSTSDSYCSPSFSFSHPIQTTMSVESMPHNKSSIVASVINSTPATHFDLQEQRFMYQTNPVISTIDTIRQISSSSPNGTARIQVEHDLTSPIIPASTSSYSTYSSSLSSAASTNSSSTSSSHSSFNKPRNLAHKCLQQTSRIVRSASSSSMNLLSNLKLNRSSRSRNSSICSTFDTTPDADFKSKPKTFLNDSMSSVSHLQDENLMHDSKTKTSNIDAYLMKLKHPNELPLGPTAPAVRQTSLLKQSSSSLSHKNLFNKLKDSKHSTSHHNHDASLPTQAISKFNLLQNKPKPHMLKTPTSTTAAEHLFSPNLSIKSDSSMFSEIIDSGIDAGIGLAASPNSPPNYAAFKVSKVLSKEVHHSYLSELSFAQSANESASIEKKHCSFKTPPVDSANDDFIITKL